MSNSKNYENKTMVTLALTFNEASFLKKIVQENRQRPPDNLWAYPIQILGTGFFSYEGDLDMSSNRLATDGARSMLISLKYKIDIGIKDYLGLEEQVSPLYLTWNPYDNKQGDDNDWEK